MGPSDSDDGSAASIKSCKCPKTRCPTAHAQSLMRSCSHCIHCIHCCSLHLFSCRLMPRSTRRRALTLDRGRGPRAGLRRPRNTNCAKNKWLDGIGAHWVTPAPWFSQLLQGNAAASVGQMRLIHCFPHEKKRGRSVSPLAPANLD